MNWVSIDLCVVPIGVGVNLAPYIATCEQVLLQAEVGPEHQQLLPLPQD